MRSVIYPGTFDPITNGHLDIIFRSAKIFDKVFVAVAESLSKNTTFDHQQRVNMVRIVTENIANVEVVKFSCLLANLVMQLKATGVIRGLRAVSDFEYEFQLANMNREIGGIESIFLVPSPENTFISSSLIKEVAILKGDISAFVPASIKQVILDKMQRS